MTPSTSVCTQAARSPKTNPLVTLYYGGFIEVDGTTHAGRQDLFVPQGACGRRGPDLCRTRRLRKIRAAQLAVLRSIRTVIRGRSSRDGRDRSVGRAFGRAGLRDGGTSVSALRHVALAATRRQEGRSGRGDFAGQSISTTVRDDRSQQKVARSGQTDDSPGRISRRVQVVQLGGAQRRRHTVQRPYAARNSPFWPTQRQATVGVPRHEGQGALSDFEPTSPVPIASLKGRPCRPASGATRERFIAFHDGLRVSDGDCFRGTLIDLAGLCGWTCRERRGRPVSRRSSPCIDDARGAQNKRIEL